MINDVIKKLNISIQSELNDLENGNVNNMEISENFKHGHYKYIRNGLLCDYKLGTLSGSLLFANVGPSIPIKFTFIGHVNTNLDISYKEYGINNILVKSFVTVKIEEIASMPISSKKHVINIKEPLFIDIIKGKVPDFYNSLK